MGDNTISKLLVALLFWGGAISLFSCGGGGGESKSVNYERMMNESSDSLEMIMAENGRTSYRFKAPVVQGYTLAKDPYREFPQGIKITTFTKEDPPQVDAVLTANFAIYYENRKLWEAQGDVTIIRADGKELFSQQLFWNASTQLIYSNVDTKIVDRVSGDSYIGEGFESTEDMSDWKFRRMKGVMGMDLEPKEAQDSTAMRQDSLAVDSLVRDTLTAARRDSTTKTAPKKSTPPQSVTKKSNTTKEAPKRGTTTSNSAKKAPAPRKTVKK
ncbi:MAG: cell division protein [Rikenellaceae bacterium]